MVRVSQSSKAGIVFPVSRIRRYSQKINPKHRISKTHPVYLAAVLEYLTAEILDLAGTVSRDCRKARITPRHLFLGVNGDEELSLLLKGVTMPEAGVAPHLHPELLPKRYREKILSSNIPSTTKTLQGGMQSLPHHKNKTIPVGMKDIPKGKTKGKSHSTVKKLKNAGSSVYIRPPVNGYIMVDKQLISGQKLTVVQGSLIDICADAIVNPTDANYSMAGQIGRLLQGCGKAEYVKILSDLKAKNGQLAPYDAILSPSCNISAKFVIHCNGPTTKHSDAFVKLERTVERCLNLADSKKLQSVAFPLIGAGSAAINKACAAEMLVKTIADHCALATASSLVQIYVVLCDKECIKAVVEEVQKL